MQIFKNDWEALLEPEMQKPYYRELRQFDKAKELLDQVGSRTHFTNEMLRHSKWKDPRVFMVTG